MNGIPHQVVHSLAVFICFFFFFYLLRLIFLLLHLYLIFCVLSIFNLIWEFLILFYSVMRFGFSQPVSFLCHVQLISCAISLICSLNNPCNYFSYSNVWIVEYTQFSCWVIFLSFFLTHNLSISRLGYKAFYLVINFPYFPSICLCSFPIHFKNGPEYHMRGNARMFFSLIRFLLRSFGSRISLSLLLRQFFI